MATAPSDMFSERSGGGGFIAFADRWIYVFMAALFIATVFAGFVPDSIGKLGAVAAGKRPPFPMILHVHSVLMGSWLLLLLAQALLVATGRTGFHKQLGLLGMALAPAMVIVGFLLIPAMDGQIVEGIRQGPPPMVAELRKVLPIVMDIMLLQIRAGVVFAVLVGIGLAMRRSDMGVHKRLMLLASAAPLGAATDRIPWLPNSMPGSALTCELWPLAVVAPMFLWDLYRQKRIHRAWWIWLGVSIVPAVAMHLLWGSDLWFRTALGLLGASDIA